MNLKTTTFFSLIPIISFIQIANAQQVNENFELSFFVGSRSSDSFDNENSLSQDAKPISIEINNDTSYGLILAWDFDSQRQGELLLSHSDSEFDNKIQLDDYGISVSYLHLGGNVPLSDGIVPIYLSGGLGATYFSPDEKGFDNEIKASANLAIGAKYKVIPQMTLRIDARIYATYIDGDSELFCSGGNCSFFTESDLWLQSELTAGFVFRF